MWAESFRMWTGKSGGLWTRQWNFGPPKIKKPSWLNEQPLALQEEFRSIKNFGKSDSWKISARLLAQTLVSAIISRFYSFLHISFANHFLKCKFSLSPLHVIEPYALYNKSPCFNYLAQCSAKSFNIFHYILSVSSTLNSYNLQQK